MGIHGSINNMKKLILIFGLLASSFSFGEIDPYIPLRTNQIDMIKMVRDADNLSKITLNNRIEKEKARIYKEGQGDAVIMLELAKKSKIASQIVPYFQEQAYQQQIYELNKLKIQAEIEKIKQEEHLNTIKSSPPPMNIN